MAKLVAIGDSMTQGFTSLAITHTDQSYPVLIAEAMGLGPDAFRRPDFRGKGGLPCSIEWLARRLEDRFGANIGFFEWLRSIHVIPDLLDEVEDYWERGKGSWPTTDVSFHNLAVWGFEVADAYDLTAAMCKQAIAGTKENLLGIPSEARLRTAYRVLNPAQQPARDPDTQLRIAARVAQDEGGIEHLILFLGANNALGTVVELDIRQTDPESPGANSSYTLWHPDAFGADYRELAAEVDAIGPGHVYVGTVPHVTIPPVTRGVMKDRGRLPASRKYFDYYTRFWIRDKDFDPDRDPHLTREEAEHIDTTIDAYNEVISAAAAQRSNWHLVDVCGVLDRLAVRRNHGTPKYPLPSELADLTIRFFEIRPGGEIKNGGLIGLDGVHPTFSGYSILAHEFLEVMKAEGGVEAREIDFAQARFWDSLVSRPPRTLDDVFGALKVLERHFHLSRWMRP
jgi:lysophospholipase L1-like esterase